MVCLGYGAQFVGSKVVARLPRNADFVAGCSTLRTVSSLRCDGSLIRLVTHALHSCPETGCRSSRRSAGEHVCVACYLGCSHDARRLPGAAGFLASASFIYALQLAQREGSRPEGGQWARLALAQRRSAEVVVAGPLLIA